MKLWLKTEKLCYFIKEPLRDYQRLTVFTILALAVLEIADELILAHNENRPPNLRKVMGHTVDSATLMGRAQKEISAERKERLKQRYQSTVWQRNIIFKIHFGENLLERMKEAKESFKISNSLVSNSTTSQALIFLCVPQY